MSIERKHLLIAIVFGLACGLVLLLVPRLLAVVSFYLGYESLKELFFARLGLSGPVSDLMAGALVFFFPMATYIVFSNVLGVLTGRIPAVRLMKIFAAYAFIYLLPAAATTLRDSIGAPQCFDQRTGKPLLFYTINPGGLIVLSSSRGFDGFGVERKPVTEEICRIADRQKNGIRPNRVGGDPRQIEFFNAAGGGASIYYSRRGDEQPELFDGPGVNPTTNDILLPVTSEIVSEIRRKAVLQEQQKIDADIKLRKSELEKRQKEEQQKIAADIKQKRDEIERNQKEQQVADLNAKAKADAIAEIVSHRMNDCELNASRDLRAANIMMITVAPSDRYRSSPEFLDGALGKFRLLAGTRAVEGIREGKFIPYLGNLRIRMSDAPVRRRLGWTTPGQLVRTLIIPRADFLDGMRLGFDTSTTTQPNQWSKILPAPKVGNCLWVGLVVIE